jgi:metal-responsive CopG/Arc/MetJ family transcriptional regulator
MPRVKVSLPDPILQVAADAAHKAGKKIDDMYEAAIGEFVERHKAGEGGKLKTSGGMPRSAIKLTIEIPEELFQEAEKLAKRLGRRRDVLYAEALAGYVKYDPNAGVDDNHGAGDGPGLPTGRWQPADPA